MQPMKPHHTTEVHGAQCVEVDRYPTQVTMALTGAQVSPVTFSLESGSASPYSLPPWLPTEAEGFDPILRMLRGDFLCLPFGEPDGGMIHGDVANAEWTVTEQTDDSILAELRAHDVDATFYKEVRVIGNQAALYQRFSSPDLTGRWNYGTHPILDLSDQKSARISTSPIDFGAVNPTLFSDPTRGETQLLRIGAEFESLSSVPMIDGGAIDLSRYPTGHDHEDLVALVNDQQTGPLGWSAVVFDHYVWIALKDIRVLPVTLLWLSNGGRTANPWNGRHKGRVGIEDVCSYFALGRSASLANDFIERGIPTYKEFDAENPFDVRTVHFAAAIPEAFDIVDNIEPLPHNHVRINSSSGHTVEAQVQWSYVLD